jgi:hypothetical protein
LKLAEPNDPNAVAVMHEIMRITYNDKTIIAREVTSAAKREKPEASGLLDMLLDIFMEPLAKDGKAS